jgi:hypothetical protein
MPEIVLLETKNLRVTNVALTTDKGKFILSAINSIKLTKTPTSSPGCLLVILIAIFGYFWFAVLAPLSRVMNGDFWAVVPFVILSAINFALLKKFFSHKTKYLHKIQLSVSSGEVTALESQDENLVLAVEKAIMQGIAGRR